MKKFFVAVTWLLISVSCLAGITLVNDIRGFIGDLVSADRSIGIVWMNAVSPAYGQAGNAIISEMFLGDGKADENRYTFNSPTGKDMPKFPAAAQAFKIVADIPASKRFKKVESGVILIEDGATYKLSRDKLDPKKVGSRMAYTSPFIKVEKQPEGKEDLT